MQHAPRRQTVESLSSKRPVETSGNNRISRQSIAAGGMYQERKEHCAEQLPPLSACRTTVCKKQDRPRSVRVAGFLARRDCLCRPNCSHERCLGTSPRSAPRRSTRAYLPTLALAHRSRSPIQLRQAFASTTVNETRTASNIHLCAPRNAFVREHKHSARALRFTIGHKADERQ